MLRALKNWFGYKSTTRKSGKHSRRPQRLRPKLEILEHRMAPAVITWVGGTNGGANNFYATDWDTATNWNPQRLPGANDQVVIDQTSPFDITHSINNRETIQGLT